MDRVTARLGTDVVVGAASSRNSTHTNSSGHIHVGSMEGSHCLIDLGVQSLWRLQQVDHLIIFHLQEHTGELFSKAWLNLVDEGDETLFKFRLLVVQRSGGQCGGCQRLLDPHINRRLMEGRGTVDGVTHN